MINLLLEFVERGIRLSANGKEVRSFIFSRDPLPCVSAALELYSIGTDVDLRASASVRYMKVIFLVMRMRMRNAYTHACTVVTPFSFAGLNGTLVAHCQL